MKTLKKVAVKPVLVKFIPSKEKMEQDTIYISYPFKTAVHLCLCGCGNESVTPLNNDGWNLSLENLQITMTPSILNTNCPNQCHYVITKGVANII